jgi:multidrug efflux pump subunit AcrB
MFLGGYVQKVMFPLVMVLTIALLSSFVVSVTIIPLAAPFIIRHAGKDERPVLKVLNRFAGYFQSAFVDKARDFFEESFGFVNRHKVVFLVGILILLPISMKLMAIVGRDLMPPMDTGIVKVRVETESDFTVGRTEQLMSDIEVIVAEQEGVLEQLSYIGGEAGLVSFGKGRTSQQIEMTINYIDRFQRDESIWELEDVLRQEIQKLQGVKYVDVTEFGATPLSSIAATVDVQLEGNDFDILDQVGQEMAGELSKRPGFTSVSRSWAKDRPEYHLVFDRHECARQGLTPVDVSYQVAIASRGVPVSVMRTFNQDGVKIRFRLDTSSRESMERLLSIPIQTPKGLQIPLSSLARAEKVFVPSVITRSGLSYTTNVFGLRATAPVSFLYDQRNVAVDNVDLPKGVTVSSQGEMKEMNSAFGRLGKALVVSIIFLYFTFVIIFRSYLEPVVIMLSIPFAAIGGVWGLLIMDKHGCMPAFMGFILLTGVIVNNAILLIDFIKVYRKEGHTLDEAVKMAIRVRTRPILMTAITTIVGMVPIAAEQAIGLERLSPLAVVAIGGLIVGTFLTLIYIPVLYILKERIIGKAGA